MAENEVKTETNQSLENNNNANSETNTINGLNVKSDTSSDNNIDNEDIISLEYVDKDFAYQLMSQPTYSGNEYRLVSFITMWARKNGIKCEFDDYGNLYLTKGELSDGEFYPCVTSHLDTVQYNQKVWAEVGLPLNIKTIKNKLGDHEMHVDDMGIGADCKSGVVISLSLFNHVDKLKACFFLEEETGCLGSKKLAKEWFDNVGYVIGWDSPELNRAAWCCSGVKLFDKTFFESHIKDICKSNGVTIFNSEPYTDVKEIRYQTDLICMNFGNGGYHAHSQTEYCVIEDMDSACCMGIDLIKGLGNKQYKLTYQASSYDHYVTNANGTKVWERDTDNDYFDQYSGYKKYTNANTTAYKSNTYSSTNSATSTNKKDENMVDIETIKYISERYEEYVDDIKKNIENKCKENNIDFNLFKDCFNIEIKF